MNTLANLLGDSALRGGLLTALAMLIYVLLRRHMAAAVRHRVLMGVFVALGAVPVIVGGFAGWKVLPPVIQRAEVKRDPLPAIAPIASEATAAVAQNTHPTAHPVLPVGSSYTESQAKTITVGKSAAAQLQWPDVKTLLVLIWGIGAVAGFTVLAREEWRLRRSWQRARPWAYAGSEIARDCRACIGLKRQPELRLAVDNEGPLVAGWWYPCVLLPADFDTWPEERRRVVLMHEFAHVLRLDALNHWFAGVVCVLHWFNPLAWWLFKQARHEAECACDDTVLRTEMQPQCYADHLLAVASGGRTASVLAPSMARPSGLRLRVKAVLDARVRRSAVGRLALIAIGTLVTLISLPLFLARAAEPEVPKTVKAKPAQKQTGIVAKFKDAEGNPVADAELRLFRVDKPEPITPFAPEVSVVSNAQGEWHGELAPGEYIALAMKGPLLASVPGNPTYWEIEKKDKTREFEFKLSPGGEVHISVQEAKTGKPLAKAQVVLDTGHCGVTDDKGELTLHAVPMGDHSAVAMAPPLADANLYFNSAGQPETKLSFVMLPGFEIRGRVTDSHGRPVKGAAVKDHYSGATMIVWLNKCVTDEEGNYQLGWYTRTKPMWSMEVTHKDYAEQNRAEIAPPAEGLTARSDFVMDEGMEITGEVRDEEGHPIKGASVRYGANWSLIGTKWDWSDAEGKFTIKKIGRTESRSIVAEAAGFAPAWQAAAPMKAPAKQPLIFILKKGLVVKGQVLDGMGKPVAQVGISPRMKIARQSEYVGNNVRSYQDGRFELRDLAATDMSYDVWGRGVSAKRGVPFDPTLPLVITVDKPGFLIGKVIDAATRKPITQYNVRLSFPEKKKAENEPSPSYSINLSQGGQDCRAEDGKFLIDDLITPARHDLWVTAPGYAMKHVERVPAMPEDDRSWPLEIAMERGQTVKGVLTDAVTGEPIGGARIFCVAKSHWWSHQLNIEHLVNLRNSPPYYDVEILKSDSAGRVELHLPAQATVYTVVIQAEGYVPVLLPNQQPSNEQLQQATLQRAASIRGIVAGLPGFDPAKDRVRIMTPLFNSSQIRVQPDGSFEAANLPVGPAVISAYRYEDGSTFGSQYLTLEAGTVHKIQFNGESSVNVEVIMDGKPAAAAILLLREKSTQLVLGQGKTGSDGKASLSHLPLAKCVLECIGGNSLINREIEFTRPGLLETVKFEFKTLK
jgi:beta-lactamase regulating signal transducer with metallopeptidase domain/protocatechuate 3,4-dioxygenase beta subunit